MLLKARMSAGVSKLVATIDPCLLSRQEWQVILMHPQTKTQLQILTPNQDYRPQDN